MTYAATTTSQEFAGFVTVKSTMALTSSYKIKMAQTTSKLIHRPSVYCFFIPILLEHHVKILITSLQIIPSFVVNTVQDARIQKASPRTIQCPPPPTPTPTLPPPQVTLPHSITNGHIIMFISCFHPPAYLPLWAPKGVILETLNSH